MSDTIYTDIRAALTQQLEAMSGLPAVAWENEDFTPVIDAPYLKPQIIWGKSTQAELGPNGRNWELGIYQIDCIYPPDQSMGPVNGIAGKIKAQFKRGTVLTYNGVTVTVRNVSLNPQQPHPTGIQLPISIAFYCQAAN